MSKKSDIKLGKADFQARDAHKKMTRSPAANPEPTNAELKTHLEFCKKELKIHYENQNNRMIGNKLEEIAAIEKKLK